MSTAYDIVVVGAGPAGVSAALEAAQRGASVLLVEQRPHAGGAIHRAAYDGGPSAAPMPARHKKNWAALHGQLKACLSDADGDGRGRIRLLTSAVFLGIDGDGLCMVDSRADDQVKLLRPRAVIFATGATERAPHVPGWELPGVVMAGGLQVQMKESGQAPRGRILVAGNGPLPLALAAQLAALGNAPVAVLEAAEPFRNAWSRPLAALRLLAGPRQLLEAAGYFRRLRAARVPYRTGAAVVAVRRGESGLAVQVNGRRGRGQGCVEAATGGAYGATQNRPHGAAQDRLHEATEHYEVDLLVLHGGLASNDRGIPADDVHGIVIARAGDCNRVLGADAALTEGRRVAAMVMGRLDGQAAQPGASARGRDAEILNRAAALHERAAAFQDAVWRLYAHTPLPPDPDTVLCRCEGVTRQGLAGRDLHSPREVRLVGRIGMGLCQGRFCAHAATMPGQDDGIGLADIDGSITRWPIRPVSVTALAKAKAL